MFEGLVTTNTTDDKIWQFSPHGWLSFNCLANRLIPKYFNEYWIIRKPRRCGSSLGAIVANTKQKLKWKTPYTGYDISGKYPVKESLNELLENGIVGVASGRAEFGPRALGNRSLFADPRGQKMKDKVNSIKQRQEFRPFAPVIRQEDVSKWFAVPEGFTSPYMQEIVRCKFPTDFPA